MTRVVVVAADEALRRAVMEALRESGAFDAVSGAAAEGEVSASADVVLLARQRGSEVLDGDAAALAPEATLTPREAEVLSLLADGLSNKQIAARLGISTNTVKTHLELVFEKLEVSTRAEAVAVAVRRGLLML